MANFTDLGKRLLVGRAIRSEKLADTLLPKRIALPVFASDALSSIAYATQEILLVLSLGGQPLVTPVRALDRRSASSSSTSWWSRRTGRTCTPTPAAAATTRS